MTPFQTSLGFKLYRSNRWQRWSLTLLRGSDKGSYRLRRQKQHNTTKSFGTLWLPFGFVPLDLLVPRVRLVWRWYRWSGIQRFNLGWISTHGRSIFIMMTISSKLHHPPHCYRHHQMFSHPLQSAAEIETSLESLCEICCDFHRA